MNPFETLRRGWREASSKEKVLYVLPSVAVTVVCVGSAINSPDLVVLGLSIGLGVPAVKIINEVRAGRLLKKKKDLP